MKVLYVSDLDGTLLNKEEKLNLDTIEELNKLIDKGVNFTISIGRGNSVTSIMKDVKLKLPVMILNGTLNYDFSKKEFVDIKSIPISKAIEVINTLSNFEFKTFEIQTILDSKVTRFEISKWNKESKCLALNVRIAEEHKNEISNILDKIDGINYFLNKVVYTENEWFCDIVSENISKASAVREFKERYEFDKVIAFGDSENDLPLLEASDEFYAVENAAEIVKQKATGVIGSCYENGVVKFISEREK